MKTRIVELLTTLLILGVAVVACVPFNPPTATPPPSPTATRTLWPTASNTPSPTATHTPTASPTETMTASPAPTSTDTPHPTDTSTPTTTPGGPGPLPTAIPIGTPDPSASIPETTAIPTPVPLLEQPSDTVNIVLMGSDILTNGGNGRTDSLIIVSVDPRIPSVSLLSIPRDLYVYIPGWKMSRINTADPHGQRIGYPGGGPGLVKATIEYNLGVRIHYFARVGFEGFKAIIDTLGGIDVVADCELHDTFPDPESEEGQRDIDLLPGVHHLDGQTALWYARSRWNTNDFDRGRRQQRVLRGMWAQIQQLGILTRLPELWDNLTQTVQTDLSLENVLWLASVASRLDTNSAIKSRFIDNTVVQSWLTPEGAQVLLPDYTRIGPLIAEALAPPDTSRARQGLARVEVLNGTTWSDWGILAADRLIWEGFQVVNIGQADRLDYQQTLIVDLIEADKGSPVQRLAHILRVDNANILTSETFSDSVDFQVIVGYDYQPCYKSYWHILHPKPTSIPAPTSIPTPTTVTTPQPE